MTILFASFPLFLWIYVISLHLTAFPGLCNLEIAPANTFIRSTLANIQTLCAAIILPARISDRCNLICEGNLKVGQGVTLRGAGGRKRQFIRVREVKIKENKVRRTRLLAGSDNILVGVCCWGSDTRKGGGGCVIVAAERNTFFKSFYQRLLGPFTDKVFFTNALMQWEVFEHC